MSARILLGPQQLETTLPHCLEDTGLGGPFATITAGWQEDEDEDDDLDRDLGGETINLRLYRRAEEIFAADAELYEAYRQRQERLQALQGLYRIRLRHAQEAARALLAAEGERDILEPEQRHAVDLVRAVDGHHRRRLAELHEAFSLRWRPPERASVARHRREIARLVERSRALVVAGGHVLVLLNRLRLFGLQELLGDRPVVAWSAGAMVLADDVVVFHDDPPQGHGAAEIIDAGLGLVPGIVPLPHARRRLRLDDPLRVALLARRFHPAACVPMDEGVRLVLSEGGLRDATGLDKLALDGAREPL
jgi:hypothetical protein